MKRRSFRWAGALYRVPFGALVLLGALAVFTGTGAAKPAAVPVNTSPPLIQGQVEVGEGLAATTGTWSGTKPISYSARWRRCDAAGANCASLSAGAGIYVARAADEGRTVRVLVNAQNGEGQSAEPSKPTAVIEPAAADAPRNLSPPRISGKAEVGETLVADRGDWQSAQSIAYNLFWQRCGKSGLNCSSISGATGLRYVVRAADEGSRIVLRIDATNTADRTTAYSSATAVVPAKPAQAPPVNSTSPTIQGTPEVGEQLSATPGRWTGATPITFRSQWQRCNRGDEGCQAISGATNSTYRVQPADEGTRLRVAVTARNKDGQSTARSAATAVVRPAPANAPRNLSAPTLSGKAQEGQALTGNRGEWAGSQPIDYNLFWQRCDQSGQACANIASATGDKYALTAADVGDRVRLRVTATNTAGRTTAFSRVSAVVEPKTAPPPPPPPPGGGQIKLPDGSISIPVTSVKPPQRLVVCRLDFRPNPLRIRSDLITARFRVCDTRNFVVRGALVFVIPLPYGWTTQPAETTTATDGWAQVRMRATSRLPRKAAIVMFVRARKSGDPVLTGVSTRRLVQMLVNIR